VRDPLRQRRLQGEALGHKSDFPNSQAVPPGWKPRLYVSQDGRRYLFGQAPIKFLGKSGKSVTLTQNL
jgi:hypothetical protein